MKRKLNRRTAVSAMSLAPLAVQARLSNASALQGHSQLGLNLNELIEFAQAQTGLRLRNPVTLKVTTPGGLEVAASAMFNRMYPPAVVETEICLLEALRIINVDKFDLRQTLIREYSVRFGAVYDPAFRVITATADPTWSSLQKMDVLREVVMGLLWDAFPKVGYDVFGVSGDDRVFAARLTWASLAAGVQEAYVLTQPAQLRIDLNAQQASRAGSVPSPSLEAEFVVNRLTWALECPDGLDFVKHVAATTSRSPVEACGHPPISTLAYKRISEGESPPVPMPLPRYNLSTLLGGWTRALDGRPWGFFQSVSDCPPQTSADGVPLAPAVPVDDSMQLWLRDGDWVLGWVSRWQGEDGIEPLEAGWQFSIAGPIRRPNSSTDEIIAPWESVVIYRREGLVALASAPTRKLAEAVMEQMHYSGV